MERILSYTLTGNGFTPAEPQFAGIQGSHRATALALTPNGEVSSFIEEKKAQGKEMFFRIDVINEAGQTFAMKDAPIEQLTQPFYLTRQMTASGLDLVAVLFITAKDESGETEVYKAQMRLYFEQVRGGTPFHEQTLPNSDLEEKYLECEQKLEEKTQNVLSAIDLKAEVVRKVSSDIAQRHEQASAWANEAKTQAQSASASAVTAEQEATSASAMLAEVRRIAHSAADLTARSEAAAARAEATADVFSKKQDLFAEVEEDPLKRVVRADKSLSFEVGTGLQKGNVNIDDRYVSASCFKDMEFSSESGGIILKGKADTTDTANVDACGCRVRNLAAPIYPGDAVNKAYFDAVLGNVATSLDLSLGIASDGLIYLFIDGSPVGTGIPQGQSGDVFGYIDENNTIVLQGNLAEEKYAVKYEMEDGSIVNIGELSLVKEPTYTNLADPTSVDWKEGYRLNSSGAPTQTTDGSSTVLTQYIDCSQGDVIRIKGITLGGYRVALYTGSATKTNYKAANPTFPSSDSVWDCEEETAGVYKFTVNYASASAMRFSGILVGTSNDVIITKNEPIN